MNRVGGQVCWNARKEITKRKNKTTTGKEKQNERGDQTKNYDNLQQCNVIILLSPI